jgi:hypothetical protein
MKESMLEVNVRDGMFSNEYTAEIISEGSPRGTVFVDKGLVKKKGSRHFLRVSFVTKIKKSKMANVLLPGEVMESGSRWLMVPAGEIVQK